MMKTQQEYQLYYWGPHYDMVREYNAKHGCDVKPWACVKLGNAPMEQHPVFDFPADSYTFSLTILYDDKRKEHRPVFVGDLLYPTYPMEQHKVIELSTRHYGELLLQGKTGAEYNRPFTELSWNPPEPKRTFKIEFTEEEFKHLCDITSNWYSRHGTTIKEKLAAARDKE